jgi:hypothetical protein
VNPYLADLIEAKLSSYDTDVIATSIDQLFRVAERIDINPNTYFEGAPPTFIEPGQNGRWIFNRELARVAASLIWGIEQLEDRTIARLFRVLLGGVLVDVSNVIISGKGRRYDEDGKREVWTAVHYEPCSCAGSGEPRTT